MRNTNTKPPSPFVRLRPATRPLWDAICQSRGWKIAEAAHRMAEHFAAAENIQLPKPRRRKPSDAGQQ